MNLRLIPLALLVAATMACNSSEDPDAGGAAGSGGGSVGSGGTAGSGTGGVGGTGGVNTGGTTASGDCLDPFAQTFVVPMADAATVGVTLPMASDGTSLFYGEQGSHLYAVALPTGTRTTVFEAPADAWASGQFWVRDDDLVIYKDGKLSKLSKTGGAPVELGAVSGFPIAVEVLGDAAYLAYRTTTSPPHQFDYVKKDLTTGADTMFHHAEVADNGPAKLLPTADGLFTLRGAKLAKIALTGGEATVDLGFAPEQLYLASQPNTGGQVYVAAIVAPDPSSGSFLPLRRFGRVSVGGGAFDAGFDDKSAAFAAGSVAAIDGGVAQFAVAELYQWKDGQPASRVACFQTETTSQNGATFHGFAAVGKTVYIGVRQVKGGMTKNGVMSFTLP